MSRQGVQRLFRWPLLLGLCLSACLACDRQQSPRPSTDTAATSLPQCAQQDLLGYVPAPAEIERHRRFSLPTIKLPFNTRQDDWGFTAALLVDPDGRPACYRLTDRYQREVAMTGPRTAVIATVADWRYQPFGRAGQPAAAVVREVITESEQPARHWPLPDVPLQQVRMRLRRGGCLGTCPIYTVEISGDGQVTYQGIDHVDIDGKYSFRIPTQTVAALVASLREKDLWSMRPAYMASITDNPTYSLTLTMGGQTHEIIDYAGGHIGMPPVITAFEQQLDEAAGAGGWINLALPAVEKLALADFPFHSPQGAQLLDRAIRNEDVADESALLRLIELGAALQPMAVGNEQPTQRPSQLEAALHNRRLRIARQLIEAGALLHNGKTSQEELDKAFFAAIEGGSLAAVQMIWDAGGGLRPSLSYRDDSEPSHIQPVTFLLNGTYAPASWEGHAIAAWLSARGCDLHARSATGDTLLNIAAASNDIDFVRYLLGQGLSPSALDDTGYPAVGSAGNESIALLLLQAGTVLPRTNKYNFDLRRYAIENHWEKVVRWLDQNPAS